MRSQQFLLYFIRHFGYSSKLGWYIGSTSRSHPVNFQVRMPKVKVTVRQNRKWGPMPGSAMAQYSLNNSSIHPTYFLPTRQKAKISLIHVPGRFEQELGWRKPTKPKDAQQCITLYTTIHHSMLCYYFRHTTDFIGQNTRGRSPHASLDINTTSNNCPVSLSRVAQLVERQTPDSEVPGSNPTNTQLLFFFLSSFVEIMFNTTKKRPFKKKKREKKNHRKFFFFQFECQFWKVERPRTQFMNILRSQ